MRKECTCGKLLPLHMFNNAKKSFPELYTHVCLCERKWIWNGDLTDIIQLGTVVSPFARHDGAGEYPFEVGLKVVALRQITEDGNVPGDPEVEFPMGRYIHANEGDRGEVEGIDDGTPTVRFERTGTATIVGKDEVAPC